MSNYDKVVKLACKPKPAPPKSKYLDTIVAATWAEDGSVADVCRALAPRLNEPNVVVVFKALIVLHTMMRNGSPDKVLSYLASTEVLRLRNVSGSAVDGYRTPQNLSNYGLYLDSRVRAYHHLKHDAIAVQSETNRDIRANGSVDHGRPGRAAGSNNSLGRSKTMIGRKLRVMTVEKGLLRETKAVHRMIDTLVECRFYLDNLDDELIIVALRMLVKDLLILFQAGNEGVINLLENYFEMSHVDATEALSIYRNFCKQTENVVEFLGVARKLQNLLNVPIPNLKHAPVSLAGALQEYLDDSDFEKNRLEYRASKAATERGSQPPDGKSKSKSTVEPTPPVPPLPASASSASTSQTPSTQPPASSSSNKQIADFFTSIEEEQPTMFNPQTNSPSQAYFHQQASTNPFSRQQLPMATGQPFASQMVQQQPTGQPFGSQMMQQQPTGQPFSMIQQQPFSMMQQQPTGQPFSMMQQQPTGFVAPQMTGVPGQSNPFNNQLLQPQQAYGHLQPQPTGHRPFSSFIPAQNTGFLRPQPTGGNPFRQSVLVPQTTGMALFSGQNSPGLAQQPAPTGMGSAMFNGGTNAPPQIQASSFASTPGLMPQATGSGFNSSPGGANVASGFAPPPRPSSTPLTKNFGASTTPIQVVKTHRTGGVNNPFGRIASPSPPPVPVPRQPTLFELQTSSTSGLPQSQPSFMQSPISSPGAREVPNAGANNTFGFNSGAMSAGSTDMSNIASSFFSQKSNTPGHPPNSLGTDGFQSSLKVSTNVPRFSVPPTASTTPSSASPPALKPHLTGFSSLKEFKPTSSFGTSLLGSLPTIPGTPNVTGDPGRGAAVQNGVGGLSNMAPPAPSAPADGGVFSPGNSTALPSNPTSSVFNLSRPGALNSATTGSIGSSMFAPNGTQGQQQQQSLI